MLLARMTPPPTARLARLRKDLADVLPLLHLTPPMTFKWASLMALYAPLEDAVLRAEREMSRVRVSAESVDQQKLLG